MTRRHQPVTLLLIQTVWISRLSPPTFLTNLEMKAHRFIDAPAARSLKKSHPEVKTDPIFCLLQQRST